MLVVDREVLFHEVDAAGIVFFAHFFTWAHEAMERFFSGVDGGYVGLITQRRVGFPAVRVEAQFRAPLRYGDAFRIETSVARLGARSIELRYRFFRAGTDERIAEVQHTVVTTDLGALASCEMPADVRRLCREHTE